MYCCLTVRKAARERVTFPDGTQTTVDASQGAELAAQWIEEHPQEPSESAAGLAKHTPEVMPPEPPGAPSFMSSGTVSSVSSAALSSMSWSRRCANDRCESHGLQTPLDQCDMCGRPTVAEGPGVFARGTGRKVHEQTPEVETRKAEPIVERVPWWFCEGEASDPPIALAPGSDRFPWAAVTHRLSELEAEGWSLVHVSEERVVEHDESWARATIVAAAIILRRAEGT